MDNSTLILSKEHPPTIPPFLETFILKVRDELVIPLDGRPYAIENILNFEWLTSEQQEQLASWFYNASQTCYDVRLLEFIYAWTTNNYEVSEGIDSYVIVFPDGKYYDGTPITVGSSGNLEFGKPVDTADKALVIKDFNAALSMARMLGAKVEGFIGGTNGHDFIPLTPNTTGDLNG